MSTTEYLVTIGGVAQKPGNPMAKTMILSSVQQIPDDWTEFEIQKDALERIGADLEDDEREHFVINTYRAVPNERKPFKVRPAGNDWMKGFLLVKSDTRAEIIMCDKCKDFLRIWSQTNLINNLPGDLYELTRWAFEHRKVCAEWAN